MKQRFAPTLLAWYDTHKRSLPWRDTRDPYRIWISEIILQQTRVAQGWAYFLRFMERFPDLDSLANASEEEVLRLWQGLGYYSRARNLHAAAKKIQSEHKSLFPIQFEQVRNLPGIGDYTAAAICSFAYDQPTAVVDGNVYRVLSRLFGIHTPIDSTAAKKEFSKLANELISLERPGDHNQAIMDFGATACTPQNPLCVQSPSACPFVQVCQAYQTGSTGLLPVKEKKTAIRHRYFHYLHLHIQEKTVLHKRTEEDIWRHLYEFPLVEAEKALTEEELRAHPQVQAWLAGCQTPRSLGKTTMPKHQLSHQSIHATFYEWELNEIPPAWQSAAEGTPFVILPEDQGDTYPMCRLMELYRSKKQNPRSSS